ncbi:MAG TPA: hypothetical protein DCO75_07505 [Fibrobacteres bacterium]|jgi:hypothetical protein|nr:hypothetical protein [Fibrobacterota bacterium]
MNFNDLKQIEEVLPPAQDADLANGLMAMQSKYSGNQYFLDPTNGNDAFDGLSPNKAKKTIDAAFALCTAAQNDRIYLMGGSSSVQVSSAFTWNKSYTHLIGVSAGGPYGRSRFGHTGAGPIVSLFTVSVNGCIFKNIHWQQGNGYAAQLNNVVLGAACNYCYFENCHFDSPLNAIEGALAYRQLLFTALSRSNTFRNCWFGDWTAAPSSTDGALIEFGGTNAGTQFFDCTFLINTTQATMVPIKCAVDVGGGNPPGYILFDNCNFLALSTGVNVLATAPTVGKLVFLRCKMFGVANLSATSSNVIMANGTAIDARYGGLGVVQA